MYHRKEIYDLSSIIVCSTGCKICVKIRSKMYNVVCWSICVCLFFQSITGKSIDFDSGSKGEEDISPLLTPDAQENELINDDRLPNGGLQDICKYFRIPINLEQTDPYIKCIQRLNENKREVKLVKRNAENENTTQEGLEDSDNENQTISSGKEEEPAAIPPSTSERSNEEPIIPAVMAAENSQTVSSISSTSAASTKMNETISDSDDQSEIQSPEVPLTTERLSEKSTKPAVIVTENALQIGPIPTIEPTLTEKNIDSSDRSLTSPGKEETPISSSTKETLSQEVIIPAVIVAAKSSETTSTPKATIPPTSKITDKPSLNDADISNRVLNPQLINMAVNPVNILNSGESDDNKSLSSVNSTTDAPVLFKNGFDEILKNAPGKQNNNTIEQGEGPAGKLEIGQKENVVLQIPKNEILNATEGDISKAGESQEKASSSTNSILLIVFAALGIVGTLAFAFNYIKKRREDREVNEMIKLEEEGRELKEVKPLIKSHSTQNGAKSKSLEYIDADPQIEVETETRSEKDQYLDNGK